MRYTENEARELVISACRILVEKKLIARTWGNVSARISDDEFVITPSGRSYDRLTPSDLVRVRTEDLSYEGDVKPSSEKGIHASVYALRDEANFVIHTHQFYASVISAQESDTEFAPCAGYGLPGTKTLRQAVEATVAAYPEFNAFLMARHGALCIGTDMDSAFKQADILEANSKAEFERNVEFTKAYPSSASRFGLERVYPVAVRNDDDFVMAVSTWGKALPAYLDDFAQLIGPEARCVMASAAAAKRALKGRNAVLLTNEGAICVAGSEDDAEAVSMILEKNAAAALYVYKAKPLGTIDANLQRLIYLKKYSRLKDK